MTSIPEATLIQDSIILVMFHCLCLVTFYVFLRTNVFGYGFLPGVHTLLLFLNGLMILSLLMEWVIFAWNMYWNQRLSYELLLCFTFFGLMAGWILPFFFRFGEEGGDGERRLEEGISLLENAEEEDGYDGDKSEVE